MKRVLLSLACCVLAMVILAVVVVLHQPGPVTAKPSVQSTDPTPSITLTPVEGRVGQSVIISGTDFKIPSADTGSSTAVSAVDVTFHNISVASDVPVNSDGNWSTSFDVPETGTGPKIVVATAKEGAITKSATFKVIPPSNTPTPHPTSTPRPDPRASLSPTNGEVDDRVSVRGSNFRRRQEVEITFDGEVVASPTTGGNGSFNVSFDVPNLPAGSYDVDIEGYSRTLKFRIQSTFSVSPSSGPPGTVVNVSGSGFKADSAGMLTIGGDAIQQVSTNSDGVLNATVTIPEVSGGTKTISPNRLGTGSATFTVTPTLTIDRSNAVPGARVTVSGTGFGNRESKINVKFDNTVVASGISADASGRWSGSFAVPDTTAGSHRVRASGQRTKESSVPVVTLSVAAGFTLGTASGPPGTVVPVSGSGSRAGERVTIIVGDNLASAIATASAQGAWSAKVTIPSAPRGPLNIFARSATGQPLASAFNITPSFTLEEASGNSGGQVTAKGEGFGANQTGISLTFDGAIVGSANANAQGSWTTTITIPSSAQGAYPVEVSDAAVRSQVPFTILPAVNLATPEAPPLSTASISGSGFAANEPEITVALGGDITLASQISADAKGSWSATFTVPELAGGKYAITVSGPKTSSDSIERQVLIITPAIELSVASGPTGTVVSVTGRGLEGNAKGLGVDYDGAAVATGINTDEWGRFAAAFEAPLSAAGNHPVTITSSAAPAPASDFRIIPSIEIDISQGPPGATVTVNGTGFGSNEANITLTYAGQELPSSVTADGQGTFTAPVAIPSSTSGIHRLQAAGPLTGQAVRPEQSFEVTPALTLSEPVGNIGSNLAVTGRGFEANKDLNISYDDTRTASVTTDVSGSFQAEFTVPGSRHGEHQVQASDASGNRIGATLLVEDTPPPVPALLSPKDGDKGGLFGGFTPTQKWTEVEDPSGVSYSLVVSRDPDFLDVVLEREGLEAPTYALTEEEALSRGKYYWRVKAVDQAFNESLWSEEFVVQSGIIPIWVIPLVVVLCLVASGSGAYAFLRFRRAQPPPRTMMPETVQITRPELGTVPALPGEVTPAAPTVTAPPRRALPSPFRRNREPSPEEQARLRLAVDFIRAIPLLEVAPDLAWTEALAEEMGDTPAAVRQQVLLADRGLIYRPPWREHPTYVELQGNPQAQNFFQSLEEYVTAVNDCAADASALLQQIYKSIADSGADEGLRENQWRYVITVAQSSIAWFRGTYLGQPSAREYEVAPALGSVDDDLVSLHWLAIPSLAGPLVEGISQEEATFYQDLHIQLRNVYRANEQARLLAAKLASTDAIRAQLFQAISQLGQG